MIRDIKLASWPSMEDYLHMILISARIEQYQSDKQLYDNISIHTWNEEDDAFDHQLDKWGVDGVFSEHSEPVKRELIAYIEDWEKLSMKKDDKRYSIDEKEMHFVKGEGYALIGNPDFQTALQLIMSIFVFMRI